VNAISPIEPVEFTPTGDETQTLLSTLDRIRATFAWKCGGLDADGTNARLGPSAVTLGGLLKHLALLEDYSFTGILLGHPLGTPWDQYDESDPEWEWRTATDDTPEQLMQWWQEAVARSRAAVAEALGQDGWATLTAKPTHWGETLNLRRLVADMIEEYARHTGHADLIRESVDGLVGEDPPRP
jgi:hypothetical protein